MLLLAEAHIITLYLAGEIVLWSVIHKVSLESTVFLFLGAKEPMQYHESLHFKL